MRFADLFKLSTRMFKARTSRTLLTILGMGIGIGAILFLVSFGYGLQKTLLERITTSDSLLTLDVTEANVDLKNLNRKSVEKIKAMPGVAEASPAFQLTSQGRVDDISADLSAVGVAPSFLRLGGVRVAKGVTLNENDPQGVVVTSAVVQVFGKKDAADMLGKEMTFVFFVPNQTMEPAEGEVVTSGMTKTVLDKKFKVVGVVDSEENMVYANSAALGELNINNYTQLKVKSDSQSTMAATRDAISKLGFSVSSLSDTVDQANKIFGVVQFVLLLFGVIALIVSAIGMFNTMTIALLERTEEIGIMKSIGASDMNVSLMFIMESTIMGFFGGLGGVLIGLIGGMIVNRLVNFIAVRFGGESVTLFYSPLWFIFGIIIFSSVVGLITGFVPARRASRIDPLDALRYK
jgi:ABC-type antimicrobial peptide transport system permease subunit